MMTSSPASPAAHPHAGPADTHRPVGRFAALRRITERVGHDSAYVFPGFFISLFAFIVLVPLFAFSVGTIIIWVGALLLPLTLLLSRAFAQLSRTRLRLWGAPLATPAYRPRQPGVFGWVKSVADPRSWLDLVFETLIAFPLRTVTFVIAVTWWAGALGGLTYLAWGVFLPAEDTGLLELIVSALTGDALTLAPGLVFLLEVVVRFVIGLVLLLALPWIMRGLAHLDAVVTTAALGTSVFEGGAAPVAGTAAREGTPAEAGSPTAPGEPSASAGSRGPAAPPAGHASGTADASPTSSGSSTDPHLGPFASVDGWAWLTAGFAAVALTAIGWPVLAAVYGVPVVVAMILALAHGAALVLTVRWSLVGLVGNVAAILATALLTQSTLGLPWPWPVTTMLTHCLVVLLLGLRHPWFVALVAWATGTAAPVAAVVMHRPDGLAGTLDSLLIAGSVSAGAAIVGVVIRQLVRSRSALRTERRATSELSARQRELQERNRIAQELHDVVAHSMSVISVQATTAEYRLPDVDPQTGEEFASIADSSRRALSEMRGLLAILRGSDEAPLVPQPTLADIRPLVDSTRQSGAHITFATQPHDLVSGGQELASGRDDDHEADDPHTAVVVPPAVGLTAYRTVQEALSNAVRHAPGSAIDVRVEVADGRLVLDVTNGPAVTEGPEDGGPPPPARVAAPGSPLPVAPGAGLGLAGIRERVGALGGTVEAGPRPDGGFTVHAELPTR
ncbi:MAG TPA: sensor domain-containing protein [Brevibacterium senegalense]|uniref:histidine kinase n=1 Tax=Brevibacterium senegalense TaxID=1033736 RepID=A0A921SNG6_9MICO|nr:sensor domain-containing protein [Brevibacterium senegalense]